MEQIEQLNHDVNQMRQELKNTLILLAESEKKHEAVEKKRQEFETRILTLLEGDKIAPELGLYPRVVKIEEFIKSIKNIQTYLAGNMAGSLFVIGVIGAFLGILYKAYLFFTHAK